MFANKTQDELLRYLGNNDPIVEDLLIETQVDRDILATLPTTFDWRTQNSKCIGNVRSQLDCGSCWAFSSTSTLADRACIKNSNLAGTVLSPEDLVLCDTQNSGCDGGSLYYAFKFFQDTGVVNDVCMPYPFKGTSYDKSV